MIDAADGRPQSEQRPAAGRPPRLPSRLAPGLPPRLAPRRAPRRPPVALLAVIIAVLLVAGVAGAVVHHPSTARGATPAGYRRLSDRTDRLSLAVPGSWQEPPLNAATLGGEIESLKITDPQLALIYDIALAALQKFQVGVFALDSATRTALFTYGTVDPKVHNVGQLSSGPIVAQLNQLGARNVAASRVHVPLGGAVQVSAQLLIGGVTVSESVDYLVVHNRLVVLVLSARGTQPPRLLLQRIEATLAPA